MATLQKRDEMRDEYDIAAYSPDRQLLLIVEVKFAKEISDENATYFRRNLIEHRLLPSAPYFMLAYRTKFFLWKDSSSADAVPDFKSAAKPVLKKYLGNLESDEAVPGPESFESAIKLWLSELASGIQQPEPKSEADKMLVDSGLYTKLKGGEVRRDFRE